MYVVLASNTGLVKVYDTKKHQVINLWGKASRDEGITKMIWRDEEQTKLLIGRTSGTLTEHALDSGDVIHNYKLDGQIAGVATLPNNRVLACTETGEIGIFSEGKEIEKFTTNRTIEAMLLSSNLVAGCQAPKTAPSADGRIIIAGGDGQLAQMLDLETKKILWTARNVPQDFLDLDIPIHDRSLAWINTQSTFVCATAHKHLRLYDIREQRKPTITVEHGERPFVTINVNPRDTNAIVASDTAANLTLFDLRRNFFRIGQFKGISGAIRDTTFHPTEPVLAAVGLDRFLHIFDANSRTSLEKTYVKQRMSAVLIATNFETTTPEEVTQEEKKEAVVVDPEAENIWEVLPTVGEPEVKKRKRTGSSVVAKRDHTQKRRKDK